MALDEIKKRSEYLCTLADEPIWRDEYDRGGEQALKVCLEEDGKITRALNERARSLVLGGVPSGRGSKVTIATRRATSRRN